MTDSGAPPSFRLAYVPGVTPGKWVRIWGERMPDVPLTLDGVAAAEASDALRAGEADACFLRLPTDRADLSVIPLYTETTVVVVPKDHVVTAAEEVSPEDLADELLLHPLDDTLDWERPPGRAANERPATTADAVELVAAGVGLLAVPQSLARLHHRRDLTYRPLTGVPESRVGLSWREDRTTELMEEFIGIVRGRTVNSSRGRPRETEAKGAKGEAKGAKGVKSATGAKDKAQSKGASRGRNQNAGARRGSGSSGGRRGGGRPRRRS